MASQIVRKVVIATLLAAFDRAALQFRKQRNDDHYEALHNIMLALRYGDKQTDADLATIIDNSQPRYFVRVLRLHEEAQKLI